MYKIFGKKLPKEITLIILDFIDYVSEEQVKYNRRWMLLQIRDPLRYNLLQELLEKTILHI